MQPKKKEVVAEWMRKASDDLKGCEALLTTNPPLTELAVFHAQQAAEKSLKAFLTFHDIKFGKIHDIEIIGGLIHNVDSSLDSVVEKAKPLTPFAVTIRYPGEDDPITFEETKDALAIAREVYTEILKRIPKQF